MLFLVFSLFGKYISWSIVVGDSNNDSVDVGGGLGWIGDNCIDEGRDLLEYRLSYKIRLTFKGFSIRGLSFKVSIFLGQYLLGYDIS